MATDTRWPLAAHMFTTVPAEGGLFLLVARGSEGLVRLVGEHLEREAFALGTGTGWPVPGVEVNMREARIPCRV